MLGLRTYMGNNFGQGLISYHLDLPRHWRGHFRRASHSLTPDQKTKTHGRDSSWPKTSTKRQRKARVTAQRVQLDTDSWLTKQEL